MKVLVVDYGMGNLGSVRRSFEECGADVLVSDNPENIDKVNKIILPGVGAFPDGMTSLLSSGWADAIKHATLEKNKPLLGICLGMQLLATESYESGTTRGLDLIPGTVERLVVKDKSSRIPHVGWNEIHPIKQAPLLSGIQAGSDFYFVHSYHFVPVNEESILATTPYCGNFVSVVGNARIFGVQFHPEKSSKVGFKLIKNFLSI